MAPAPIPDSKVDTNLKSIIQTLYDLQSSTHGHQGPATDAVLVAQIQALAAQLASLSQSASSTKTSSNPLSTSTSNPTSTKAAAANTDDAGTTPTLIPPEIIAYVDDGRNPDIYTREFVELVQRGNGELRGKSQVLGGFAACLGEGLGVGMGLNGGMDVEIKGEEKNDGEVIVKVEGEGE